MRITIEHSEKSAGWVSKTRYPMISLKVEFSEEEKQIIKEANIDKVVIMERAPSADNKANFDGIEDVWYLTFESLLHKQAKGVADEYCVLSPGDARVYETNLKSALKEAKDYMEANRGVEEKSTSFEL